MTNATATYRFYNQSAEYLRRLEDAGWRPEYGAILSSLRRFQVPQGSRVLDFGCGVGDLVAALAGAGYRATGAEVSLPFLANAQQRHPGLPFVALGTGPQLPLDSRQFAAITSVNTIEHIAKPAATLKELARVLRPGGLLVLTFPNLLSPLRPLRRFVTRRRPLYGPESGNSAGESLGLLVRNLTLLARISLTRQPQFRPRQADFVNAERYRLLGYGADYDAVWLANPLDVAWRLRQLGLEVPAMGGIPGAAERHSTINRLRQLLPTALTSPILLTARKPTAGEPTYRA